MVSKVELMSIKSSKKNLSWIIDNTRTFYGTPNRSGQFKHTYQLLTVHKSHNFKNILCLLRDSILGYNKRNLGPKYLIDKPIAHFRL